MTYIYYITPTSSEVLILYAHPQTTNTIHVTYTHHQTTKNTLDLHSDTQQFLYHTYAHTKQTIPYHHHKHILQSMNWQLSKNMDVIKPTTFQNDTTVEKQV